METTPKEVKEEVKTIDVLDNGIDSDGSDTRGICCLVVGFPIWR